MEQAIAVAGGMVSVNSAVLKHWGGVEVDTIIKSINPHAIFIANINIEEGRECVYTLGHFGLGKRNAVEFQVNELELLEHILAGDVLEYLDTLAIQQTIAG